MIIGTLGQVQVIEIDLKNKVEAIEGLDEDTSNDSDFKKRCEDCNPLPPTMLLQINWGITAKRTCGEKWVREVEQ